MSRRACLAAGLALSARAWGIPGLPASVALWQGPRELWITRPQCQESVRAVYWADGHLEAAGYAQLQHLYRDVQAGVEHPIALGLLDLNFALQRALAQALRLRPVVLFSGYRTAITNQRVGGTQPNVHGAGIADDYVLEGLSLLDNYRLARHFQVGGLGVYPERGSLHKDIGPLRSWVTRGA